MMGQRRAGEEISSACYGSCRRQCYRPSLVVVHVGGRTEKAEIAHHRETCIEEK